MFKDEVRNYFINLQQQICTSLEALDGKSQFNTDIWKRLEGGGGISRIIENGNIIEKGGVNFSAVWGILPNSITKAMQLQPNEFFFATGISIVIHPQNPFVPIIHLNTRYFETENGNCWFGGGIDLTPHYIVDEDAVFFHNQLKTMCNKHNAAYYHKFKQWADDYFFIKHRNETRGIGGIFFDKLKPNQTTSKETIWEFVKDVGKTFLPTYTHLININYTKPFTEHQKQWQLLRRGRYVEFNLVYDAGTKFGLETNGRIESILMSLPTTACWFYNHTPLKNSPEEYTLSKLYKGINW